MLLSATDLLRFSATNGDDVFPVTDLLFQARSGRVTYVALDTGGWLEHTHVLIKADRIGAPDPKARSFEISLTSEAVESAPRWETGDSRLPFGINDLPPLVVGPFGSTYAPLMMAAQMEQARAEDAPDPDPDTPPADTDRLDRVSVWSRVDAYGTDGELGRLTDLLIDPADMRLTHFVISTGGLLSAREKAVPWQALRHMADGDTHLVLDISSAALKEAPDLGDLDAFDETAAENLRLYYGLPV